MRTMESLLEENEILKDALFEVTEQRNNFAAQIANSSESQIIKTHGKTVTFTIDGTISLDAINIQLIKIALDLEDNNETKAAKLLKISRTQIRYQMKINGLKITRNIDKAT